MKVFRFYKDVYLKCKDSEDSKDIPEEIINKALADCTLGVDEITQPHEIKRIAKVRLLKAWTEI